MLLRNSCMPLSLWQRLPPWFVPGLCRVIPLHYHPECPSDPCTTILCVRLNCMSYSCKPSRSVIPVCPSIGLLSPAVPSLGKSHLPHYQELGLSVKLKKFHQWSNLPSLPSTLLQVHLFSVSKAVDHAMHPSEMHKLPPILEGLLFPKSNTNIGLPSLTDSNPQPFIA